jgi:hypothetical protein
MKLIDSTTSKRSPIRISVLLLLALVSFAFVLEGSQPVHSHENGRLGLYNAECPLAELAAIHADGGLSVPTTIARPAQADLPVSFLSFTWMPSPSFSLADTRAPPLA